MFGVILMTVVARRWHEIANDAFAEVKPES
jgi:hypothetical protein